MSVSKNVIKYYQATDLCIQNAYKWQIRGGVVENIT